MLRSFALGTGVLTLGLGLATGAGGGIAAAKTPPTTFSGDIGCAATGAVGFNPAITNSGSSPDALTVKLKLSGCSGAGATAGAVTLSRGTLKATTSVPFTSACEAVVSGGETLPPASGTINWKGKGGTIVSSAVTISKESLFFNSATNTLDVYLGTATVGAGGSFAGQHVTFGTFTAKKNAYKMVATCNGKGIKVVAVGSSTANVGA
jgi:hypothetical protein